MSTLPTSEQMVGDTVTELDFKNKLTQLLGFLSGLLGTTGAPVDALVALGAAPAGAPGTLPSYTDQGNFTSGQTYNQDDLVNFQNGDTGYLNVYLCTVASTTSPPLNDSFEINLGWELFPFSTESYVIELVSAGGSSGAGFPAYNDKGYYSGTPSDYVKGDIVIWNDGAVPGTLWVWTGSGNPGNDPQVYHTLTSSWVTTTGWQILPLMTKTSTIDIINSLKYTYAGEYQNGQLYTKNSIIAYNNNGVIETYLVTQDYVSGTDNLHNEVTDGFLVYSPYVGTDTLNLILQNVAGVIKYVGEWNIGTVTNGSSVTTTTTVSGVLVGMPVVTGHTAVVTSGILLYSVVSAGNTVTTTLYNMSGSDYTPSDGSLFLEVFTNPPSAGKYIPM